jgi:RNA polymerase sigma factor (sigma-70 family)
MQQRQFATTRWSVVLEAAQGRSGDSSEALAMLCQTYWYPLYAFVRRQGHRPDEAEDLTQEFFARLMEKKYLAEVGPEKGRFRSFLLVCMKRFLANEWDRSRAQKRGSGRIVSIDVQDAEGRYRCEPTHLVTPEKIYQRRWALTVLERTIARLAAEMNASGKGKIFQAIKGHLSAEGKAPEYATIGKTMGLTTGAVRVATHRIRERYRALLREEIAGTVSDAADIDAEIAELISALGA